MKLEVDRQPDYSLAKLCGHWTQSDEEDLIADLMSLVEGAKTKLVIDLSALEYINSIGLAALMNLVARSRLAGGRVVLLSPTTFVAGILNVTHLDHWFEVCDNLDEAKRRLAT